MAQFTQTPDIASIITGYEQRISALERTRPLALTPVTALPPAPFEGQTIIFAADQANGVMWPLRYRGLNADGSANASAFKWEADGDLTPLTMEDAASVACGGAAAAIAADAITLPLAGDYTIEFGGRGNNAGTNVAEATQLFVKLDAAALSNTEAISFNHAASLAAVSFSGARKMRRNGLIAGALLQLWRSGVNNTDTWNDRFMFVRPVRVG